MTKLKLLAAVSLACICSPAIAHGDAEAGEATFEENCANCHFEDDFADEADSVLKAMILAVINGEIEHRGDFSDLSEQDAANLAAFLEQQ